MRRLYPPIGEDRVRSHLLPSATRVVHRFAVGKGFQVVEEQLTMRAIPERASIARRSRNCSSKSDAAKSTQLRSSGCFPGPGRTVATSRRARRPRGNHASPLYETPTLRPLGTPTNAGYSVARDGGSCLHGLGLPTPGSRTGPTATLNDSSANAPYEAHGQRNMDGEVLR